MKFKLFVVGIGQKGSLQNKMDPDEVLNQKYTRYDYLADISSFDISNFMDVKNNAMQVDYKHNQYFETPDEVDIYGVLKCESEDGVTCHLEVIKVVNNMVYGECEYDIYAKLIGYQIDNTRTYFYLQEQSVVSGSGSGGQSGGQSGSGNGDNSDGEILWKDEDGTVRSKNGVYRKIGDYTYFLDYGLVDYTETPFYSSRDKDIFYYLYVTSSRRSTWTFAICPPCEIEKIQFEDGEEEWISVEDEPRENQPTTLYQGWLMWGFKLRFKPYIPKDDDKGYRTAKVYVYQPMSELRLIVPLVQTAYLAEVKTVVPEINSSNPGYKMILNEDEKMKFLRDETGLKQMIFPRTQQNEFGILAKNGDDGRKFKEGHFSFAFTSNPDIDAKQFLKKYKNGPDSIVEQMCYHWIYNTDPIPIYAVYTFDKSKFPSDNMFFAMSNIYTTKGYDETNYPSTATNNYQVGSERYKQSGKDYGDRLCSAYLLPGDLKTFDDIHNYKTNNPVYSAGTFYNNDSNGVIVNQSYDYMSDIKNFCEECESDKLTIVIEYLCYMAEEDGHFVYRFLNNKSKEQTSLYDTPRLLLIEDDEYKSLFNTLYGKVYGGTGWRHWNINYWLGFLAPLEDGSEIYRDIRCMVE